MKKLFIVMAVASLGFVACNNDSDTSAAEKAKADSIAAKAKQDSIDAAAKAAVPAGPTPAELEAKRVADSIHIADSIKAAKKK